MHRDTLPGLASRRQLQLIKSIAYALALAAIAAVVFWAATGFAAAEASATTAIATATTQPVWLTMLLGLAPWLIGAALAFHPMLKLAALLQALAAKHTGLAAALIGDAGIVAANVDAYLSANGQSLKDLVDPAKRAVAEAALVSNAKTQATAAVDEALKRGL